MWPTTPLECDSVNQNQFCISSRPPPPPPPPPPPLSSPPISPYHCHLMEMKISRMHRMFGVWNRANCGYFHVYLPSCYFYVCINLRRMVFPLIKVHCMSKKGKPYSNWRSSTDIQILVLLFNSLYGACFEGFTLGGYHHYQIVLFQRCWCWIMFHRSRIRRAKSLNKLHFYLALFVLPLNLFLIIFIYFLFDLPLLFEGPSTWMEKLFFYRHRCWSA